MSPVVAQGMSQVQLRPELGEHVRGPVPPVGGLEHHLGGFAGSADHLGQRRWVVGDLHRLDRLAVGLTAHDHAAAAVQVDPDVLWAELFHGCFLSS